MVLPETSITVSPKQLADLNNRLSAMRHNVNNHLSLVVAACELMRRKPELAMRMLDNILQQPERINVEIRDFSDVVEVLIGLKPAAPPSTAPEAPSS